MPCGPDATGDGRPFHAAGTLDLISAAEARTLPGLFLRRCARTPGAEAYRRHDASVGQWRSSTWREIRAAVGRWQAALAREGLARGDRVAVLAPNSGEWVCFDQAAQGLGLVVVPLYTTDSPGNIAYILGDSGARLLLVGAGAQWRALAPLRGEFPALARILCLDENGPGPAAAGIAWSAASRWLPADAPPPEDYVGEPDALATLVYTSGTTGRPKGVMLSHAAILANAESVLQIVPGYREDLYLSFLPLSHAFERTAGYYVPMMAGSAVAFARSAQLLAEDLLVVRPTVLVSVPRIYERAYARIMQGLARRPLARALFDLTVGIGWRRFEAAQARGPGPGPFARLAWPLLDRLVARRVRERFGGRVRLAVSGGAPLAPNLARCFIGLGLPLVQGYGLTEAAPVVAANRVEDNLPESVGAPLPGTEVRLGEKEELLVRSPSIMLGYWQRPDATREAIDAEGWLHTGDQARIEVGRVRIVGRLKEVLILSTAEKIAPADLEMAIAGDPLFEQAMVLGEAKPYLAALIVLSGEAWPGFARSVGVVPGQAGALAAPAVVNAALKRVEQRLERFPSYARVRRAWLTLEPWTIESGLITPTMKLKRTELTGRYAREIAALYEQDRAAPGSGGEGRVGSGALREGAR
jgi:long-chain acyl-CoA synthetase